MKTLGKYHYSGPSCDHGLLSPSGRCSKRTRKAAEAINARRLFAPTGLQKPEANPQAQNQLTKKEGFLRLVQEYRARDGKMFNKFADQAQKKADRL